MTRTLRTDALVVGGGIGGLQAALDLAEQGYSVTIVEREPSIGGRMIALSKVFPTLDCSSCICTPKMAAAAHHENVSILTYTEVGAIRAVGDGFEATVTRKPRYVREDACIGCRLCEYECESLVPNEYEGGLGARKAIHVPFANAIPQVAVLDIEECALCGRCAKVCPTDAIDYLQEPEELRIAAGAVVLATGYRPTDVKQLERFGGGRIANVIDGLQMERLLAPHGPYGRVLRPSDGEVPDRVAFVHCAGSRDRTLGVTYCSRVCCMYAIKQAMLLSGSLPLVDITLYYIDIRAFGKGFEAFYQNARAMGIEFVKAKVARITEDGHGSPIVRIEQMEDGRVEERTHDLVVLTPGLVPSVDLSAFAPVRTAADGFVLLPNPEVAPGRTGTAGVFVAGAAAGPKDIPDTILTAGAAASEAAAFLRSSGWRAREPEPAVATRFGAA